MGENHVVVSHISASNVHELGDLVATRHEFSSRTRRQTAQQDVYFYRQELVSEDTVLKDGLPVTSVARTLADLAELHVDFDHLAQVVKDALSKGAIDFQTLVSRLSPGARSYNYSSGEDFADALINEAGLPATTESLLARNLSSTLSPQLAEVLKEINSPQYSENLREGLKAVLPALNAANEITERFSKILESHVPTINPLPWTEQLDLSSWSKGLTSGLQQLPGEEAAESSRAQNPEPSAPTEETEQQAGDHEANES